MVIATGRCVGVDSAIFAVASVVAIITMHDAMGVRHETGEQAKVLNQMIDQWIDISEKNAPFLQKYASEGNGRPYTAAGSGRRSGGYSMLVFCIRWCDVWHWPRLCI